MNIYLKMIVGHEIADITEKSIYSPYCGRSEKRNGKDNKMIGGRHCPAAFFVVGLLVTCQLRLSVTC